VKPKQIKLKYTKEQITEIVKECLSVAQCLRKLEVRAVGGNYKWFKKILKTYEIDTAHFTGQGWNRGNKKGFNSRTLSLAEILIKDSPFQSSGSLRKRLIREGIKKGMVREVRKFNVARATYSIRARAHKRR
jgi:hypothetical protein